ncbi:MAG: protein kinase [Anaerolineae bacterium]|nr:protein kinase [Anaerolineae bacterium]
MHSNFGRYTIIRELGRGGMATVYLAHAPHLSQYVALKLLPSEFLRNPRFRQHFSRETQIVAGLQHPAIVPVYDHGEYNEQPFIVMRYMSGGTLEQRMAQGTMPPQEVGRILGRVATGLDYAHQRRIVHRDIKPANILFDEHNQAYISDFGIARLLDETTTVGIIGTPGYMAPEQALGRRATARSDIYALGVILYEMLTEYKPYEAPTTTTRQTQGKAPIPSVQRFNPVTPTTVDPVVAKALHSDPGRRFAAATAFTRAYRDALTRRTPIPNWLIATGLITILFLFALMLFTTRPNEPSTIPSLRLVQQIGNGTTMQTAVSPDGSQVAVAGSLGVWLYDTELTMADLLEGHETPVNSASWSPDGTSLASASSGPESAIIIWDVAARRRRNTLLGHENDVARVVWSPDGATLLSAGSDNTVRLWDSITGQIIETLREHSDAVWDVQWSPDGTKFASGGRDNTVKIWDSDTRNLLKDISGHTGPVNSIAWSPDNAHLASASDDGTIKVWNSLTGSSELTLNGHNGPVLSVTWSDDGARLATGGEDKTVIVWDAATGVELKRFTNYAVPVLDVTWHPNSEWLFLTAWGGVARWDSNITAPTFAHSTGDHLALIWDVAWSPDGSQVASVGWDRQIHIWDITNGEQINSLDGHDDEVTAVSWSPDGNYLVTGSLDQTVRIWDVAGRRLLQQMNGHSADILDVAWSPNGNLVASTSAAPENALRIWDSASGQEIFQLVGHRGSVNALAWSFDGKFIATASDDQTLRIWDSESSRMTIELSGHTDEVLGVAWASTNDRVASAGRDNTIIIWDVSTGRPEKRIYAHSSAIASIDWNGDDLLVSASWNGMVRVWDIRTGLAIASIDAHNDSILSVVWSPDDQRLISAGRDGVLKVWQ